MKNKQQQQREQAFENQIKKMEAELILHKFATAAWDFAKSVLWENSTIDEDEKTVSIDSIKIFFENRKHDLPVALMEYCERVVMAKWYVDAEPTRYIPSPAFWFNYCNEKGFKGTAKWFLNSQVKRKNNPNHLMGLKALAAAYVDYINNPSCEVFNFGRDILLVLNEPKLIQLFNNSVIHFHYIAA
jgi:hypothetical protein